MGGLKSHFKYLSDGEKAAYLISNGRQITSRKQGEFIANLYSVDDFLVEVIYDSETVRIRSIEVIENSDLINLYIDSGLSKK
mgnify:CR=1 FL=1